MPCAGTKPYAAYIEEDLGVDVTLTDVSFHSLGAPRTGGTITNGHPLIAGGDAYRTTKYRTSSLY